MIKHFPHKIDPEFLPPTPRESAEEQKAIETYVRRMVVEAENAVRAQMWSLVIGACVFAFALGMVFGIVLIRGGN